MPVHPVFIPAVVWDYVAQTANYQVVETDKIIDCTANSFTVTLLSAVGRTGQEFHIKNSGVGLITVVGTGGEFIDGDPLVSLVQGEALYVVSNGTNWIVI